MKKFVENNMPELLLLIKQLCAIPAPSHFEKERAEFCRKWFEENGADGVYIDEALNVILSVGCEDSDEITVFAAHTDTVFPDTEPMPYYEDDEKICCPGVGDDTASVAAVMLTAKYFIENKIVPEKGVMFVCNSCEEGLGNLKGISQLFKDYSGRIKQFVTVDSTINVINDVCVGSHRYEVEVLTEGGHSFQKFGNANAINELSKIVSEIYKIEVPQIENSRTTYNVGEISGGTSINTIAQNARMLCEYRSDNNECLEIMQKRFEEIFSAAKSDKVAVRFKKIGDRPCAKNVDPQKLKMLVDCCKRNIEEISNKQVRCISASTDYNIPLSLGTPAVCIGSYYGALSHTREEYIEKKGLDTGLLILIKIAVELTA